MRQVRLDISHKLLLTLLKFDPESLQIESVWMAEPHPPGDHESQHYFSMLLTGEGVPKEFDVPEGALAPTGTVECFEGDEHSTIV